MAAATDMRRTGTTRFAARLVQALHQATPVRNTLVLFCAAVLMGCGQEPSRPESVSSAPSNPSRQSATVSGDAGDDATWTHAAKDYASTRYSRLTQVTTVNASQLGVK